MVMRRMSGRARLFIVGYGMVLGALLVLAFLAHANPYFAWDLRLAISWQAVTVPGLAPLMRTLTRLGDTWHPYAILAVVAGTLALWGAKRDAMAVIASALAGKVLVFVLKLLVHRPRPSATGIHIMIHRPTLSFPSGHVVNFMCFYGFLFALAFLHMRRGVTRTVILIVLGLLLIGIGPSRVYVGEHWPSDVIGGYLIGLLWLGLVVPLYQRWHVRRAARASAVKGGSMARKQSVTAGQNNQRFIQPSSWLVAKRIRGN